MLLAGTLNSGQGDPVLEWLEGNKGRRQRFEGSDTVGQIVRNRYLNAAEMKLKNYFILIAIVCPFFIRTALAMSHLHTPIASYPHSFNKVDTPKYDFGKNIYSKYIYKKKFRKDNTTSAAKSKRVALLGLLFSLGAVVSFFNGSFIFIPAGLAGLILSIIGLKKTWRVKGPSKAYAIIGILLFIVTAAGAGILIALLNQ